MLAPVISKTVAPVALLTTLGISCLNAEDVTMDLHNQSWRLATAWSDDLFPTADKDYFLTDLGDNLSIMRSTRSGSSDGSSTNFPGRSLTIPADTNFLVKQDLDNTASLNDGAGDLILDGGAISFAPQSRVRDNNPRIRAKDLHVTDTAGSFITITGEVDRARFESSLTGPGDLRVTFANGTGPSTSGRSVSFNAVRDYSGRITLEKGMILDFNEDAFFEGGIEILDSAQLNVDQILTFPVGSLIDSQNGVVPPGIYSGTALTALGNLYRDNGGAIVIGDITVTTANDEDNGNLVLTDGQGISLREAIANAQPETRIIFDSSLDGQIIQLDASLGELVIDKSLHIDASDLPGGIIIDGGSNGNFVKDANETRCFFISDGEQRNFLEVNLHNLTIQNGVFEGDDAGGNIHNRENLTLTDCQILNGRTFGGERNNATGGGIFSEEGSLTMTTCTVSGNRSQGRFAGGGGIYVFDGDLVMTSCTISENQTLGEIASGGGVFSNTGNLTMTACTVSGNQTHGNDADGGGIFRTTSNLGEASQIVRCTITENRANNASGGSISNNQSQLTIQHCTIVRNSALEGAGVSSNDNSLTSTEISYSIVRDNLNGFDLALQGSGNINSFAFSGSNLIGSVGTGITGITLNTEPILLALLANYGGPTETMPPRLGSPAIDAATGSTITEDQRGFSIFATADIGATESIEIQVTTPADEHDSDITSGTGISLREAIRDANAGDTITFAPALAGGTIQLEASLLGELVIDKSLTIDASDHSRGIIIDGGSNGDFVKDENETRCFLITDGDEDKDLLVLLNNLTIQNGVFEGITGGGNLFNSENLTVENCRILNGRCFGGRNFLSGGGGIFSQDGRLTLIRSLVSGNQNATRNGQGGGVFSLAGPLTLEQCTISDNRVIDNGLSEGGGISCSSGNLSLDDCTVVDNHSNGNAGGINFESGSTKDKATLTRCTITRNIARREGGGIRTSRGTMVLSHCTIVENTSNAGSGSGVASFSLFGEATLSNCIVQNNNNGNDIELVGVGSRNSFQFTGTNLIGSKDPRIGNATLNTEPILLAPLANYGGPTKTMPPLPGSPAIDAATGSTITKDQRGFAITKAPDIGAVDLQGDSSADEPILSFFFDEDSDGLHNGLEQAIGSDPFLADFDHPNRLQIIGFENGELQAQFGYVDSSIPLKLVRSTDLITFDEVIASSADNLTADSELPLMIVTDPSPPAERAFYRLEVTLPE